MTIKENILKSYSKAEEAPLSKKFFKGKIRQFGSGKVAKIFVTALVGGATIFGAQAKERTTRTKTTTDTRNWKIGGNVTLGDAIDLTIKGGKAAYNAFGGAEAEQEKIEQKGEQKKIKAAERAEERVQRAEERAEKRKQQIMDRYGYGSSANDTVTIYEMNEDGSATKTVYTVPSTTPTLTQKQQDAMNRSLDKIDNATDRQIDRLQNAADRKEDSIDRSTEREQAKADRAATKSYNDLGRAATRVGNKAVRLGYGIGSRETDRKTVRTETPDRDHKLKTSERNPGGGTTYAPNIKKTRVNGRTGGR